MPEPVDAIISIHPHHAEAILKGRKTIELRRRLPHIAPGSRLWIYATLPTGTLVGLATIADVDKASPTTIWRRHRSGVGIDYETFKEYFFGAQEAVALVLNAVQRVGPITIEQLRCVRNKFHPPQVLVTLTTSEAKALRKLAKI